MQKYSEDLTLKKIAVIRTDFPEKFGLPRQSSRTGHSCNTAFNNIRCHRD